MYFGYLSLSRDHGRVTLDGDVIGGHGHRFDLHSRANIVEILLELLNVGLSASFDRRDEVQEPMRCGRCLRKRGYRSMMRIVVDTMVIVGRAGLVVVVLVVEHRAGTRGQFIVLLQFSTNLRCGHRVFHTHGLLLLLLLLGSGGKITGNDFGFLRQFLVLARRSNVGFFQGRDAVPDAMFAARTLENVVDEVHVGLVEAESETGKSTHRWWTRRERWRRRR